MLSIKQTILSLAAKLAGADTAFAHCDYPCGIYDPHQAQIGALTVIRMMDLMREHAEQLNKQEHGGRAEQLNKADHGGHDELELRNNIIRAVNIKEEHAELVKREIRVIWGDYFKAEHLQKRPELNDLVREIMQLGSKCRQTAERTNGEKLLEAVNKFAEIFWDSKGVKTYRAKAPYKPEAEMVYPNLKS